MSYVEHDVVGSPMLDKSAQLVFEIFRLLSGKTGYRVVASEPLGRHAVTVFAIADFGLHISRTSDPMLCAGGAR
jgi:hypothetical protein